MKFSNICLILLALVLAGNVCFTHILENKIRSNRKIDYPIGATKITPLGHGWSTFRLRIGGKNRLFLRHIFMDSGSEAMTEILNAKEEPEQRTADE